MNSEVSRLRKVLLEKLLNVVNDLDDLDSNFNFYDFRFSRFVNYLCLLTRGYVRDNNNLEDLEKEVLKNAQTNEQNKRS